MRTQDGPVSKWLSTLDPEWRSRPGQQLLEFGDCIVYPQIRLEGFGPMRAVLRELATLAEKAQERRYQEETGTTILDDPRLLEVGMLFHLVAASDASHIPRTQPYFPSVLLERLVLATLAGEGEISTRLIHRLLPTRHRTALAAVSPGASLRGYGFDVRWPTPAEAGRMLDVLRACRGDWEKRAGSLLHAISDERVPARGLGAGRSSDAVELLALVNQPAQREGARIRLQRALAFPERAEAILANLARPEGWFALHTAWILRVLDTVHRRRYSGRPVKELALREVLLPLSRLEDDFLKKPLDIHDQAPPLADARRRQLSRERADCLDMPLPVLEDEDLGLLQELAELRLAQPRAAGGAA